MDGEPVESKTRWLAFAVEPQCLLPLVGVSPVATSFVSLRDMFE